MNSSTVDIFALYDEILLIIFNKLNNIDVLYSILGVNEKLDKLAGDIHFTRSLDLTTISSNELNNSRTNSVLNRFCSDIISRIQHSIECLTLDQLLIDRILDIGSYPKLHQLTIVNLELEVAVCIFNGLSLILSSFKDQISHISITMIDDDTEVEIVDNVATLIFAGIFHRFTKLTHFDLQNISVCPSLLLINIPYTPCYSSSIVHLNVRISNLDDCLCLLDERLSQLYTFIVEIDRIDNSPMTPNN